MMNRNMVDRFIRPGQSPETVDRVLLGVCAGIWLTWLGLSVAATVALVDLGRGYDEPTTSSHTGLLYVVIGVSALVILGAIPVLLRARQPATPRPPGFDRPRRRSPSDRTPRCPSADSMPRAAARPSPVRRRPTRPKWIAPLRGITVLAGAVGTSLGAVSLATYLMATGADTGSWVCYGVAGAVAVAMPVIPWLYLRRLDEVQDLPARLG